MSPRNALFWLAVLAAAVLLVAQRTGAGGGGAGPPDPQAARVERVVDGDTVMVRRADGSQETVRYIGVDTPESVKPDAPVECFGKAAARRNAELVAGQAVRLVVGVEPRDHFGRLLAYVYRSGDGLFVNEQLIRDGAARPLMIAPNGRYASRFERLARRAEDDGRGLWGRCPER